MKETIHELKKAFYVVWDDLWTIWMTEILFVVCSLPIVTAPAAFTGFYYTMHELANGESVGWRTFFNGIKQYIWVGYRWFGLNLVVVIMLLFDAYFFLTTQSDSGQGWGLFFSGIPLGVLVLWGLLNLYTFPLMLIQEKPSYRQALCNSIIIYLKWPGFVLIFSLLSIIILVVSAWLTIPWLIFGVSLPALLSCIGLRVITEEKEKISGM